MKEVIEKRLKSKAIVACSFRGISKSKLIERFTSKMSFDAKINSKMKLSSFIRMCNVLEIDCVYFLCEGISIDMISKYQSSNNYVRGSILVFFDDSVKHKDSPISPASITEKSTIGYLLDIAYSKPYIMNSEREFLSPDELMHMVFRSDNRQ